MAKLILDNDSLAEAFFENACLLGIMAPMPDHQFCGLIREGLGFQLRNDPLLEITLTKRKRQYYFSVFKYTEPVSKVEHFVFNNKCDGEYLLPEFKHLDFAWMIKEVDPSSDQVRFMIAAIKALNDVQLVIELTNEKIRNKQHLMM